MRAVVYRRYGGPEVLEVVEAPTPTVREGQVLVGVRATSVNAADYRLLRANPFLARLDNGLLRLNEAAQIRKRFERLRLPLVFADATDCSRLTHWGVLSRIDCTGEETAYKFTAYWGLEDVEE